jgi:hypothetical protein
VIDTATQALLQDIARRESRSLLQYLGDSFPWDTLEGMEAQARLEPLIREESCRVAALLRYMARRRIELPYLGAYPMTYTNINNISMTSLLPLVKDYLQKSIADLDRELSRIGDAEAHRLVHELLDDEKRHLKQLESPATLEPALASH